MTLEHTKNDLTASFDGTALFRYVFRPADAQPDSPRPYLHPVRTLGGDTVSLYRPDGHAGHRGISLSLPNIGAMVHGSFETAEVTDDVASIGERLTWVPEDRTYAIIIEHRRMAAVAWPSDNAWCLAFETTLTNVCEEDLLIGTPVAEGSPDAGHGGLFWRGPRSFAGGTVLTPDGPGGEPALGSRGPWLGYSGQHDGGGASTLVFRDDPSNFAHPTPWFVRSAPFAGAGPAPFLDTEHVFSAGAWLTLRYDIVVADGALDAGECAVLAERAGEKDLLA